MSGRFAFPHQARPGDGLEGARDALRNASLSDIVNGRLITVEFAAETFVFAPHGLGRRAKGAIVVGQDSTAYSVRALGPDAPGASTLDADVNFVIEARDAAGVLLAITGNVIVWVF